MPHVHKASRLPHSYSYSITKSLFYFLPSPSPAPHYPAPYPFTSYFLGLAGAFRTTSEYRGYAIFPSRPRLLPRPPGRFPAFQRVREALSSLLLVRRSPFAWFSAPFFAELKFAFLRERPLFMSTAPRPFCGLFGAPSSHGALSTILFARVPGRKGKSLSMFFFLENRRARSIVKII